MNKLILILFSLFICEVGVSEIPHIGYSYPMGGQRGSTFEAIIGGQYLDNEAEAYVNGSGIKISVLDVFEELDKKSLGRFKRMKNNLEAQIEEREGKREETRGLRRRLEKVEENLSAQEKAKDEMRRIYDPKQLKMLMPKKQFNPQIASMLRVKVTISRDAPEGERELRVRTAGGLSNPIFFHVGTLPEILEEELNNDHHSLELQTVSLPALINGQVMPGDLDCFRFTARKDQMIVIDVSARRLIPYLADAVPGWFQAVITLYDEDGNEVGFTDDYKFNPDPVLFYKVPKTAEYTLQIKDAIYRGRKDFIYRISIGELPFITSIFPLGARIGSDVDIQLRGVNLPTTNFTGHIPRVATPNEIRQISVMKGIYRSNSMPFALGNDLEVYEQEPNSYPEEAQPITLPSLINGRIHEVGDHDYFLFEGKKGEKISIDVHARRLNSPLDSIIKLSGPGLNMPLINDDHVDPTAGLITHHADSYLFATLPADGTFLIDLSDTQMKAGDDYAYRLRVGHAVPDFELRMDPSGMNISAGGTAVFNLHVIREDGFNGKIAIDAKDLPAGFEMSHVEIAAGENETRFTLTAPRVLKQGKILPKIIGTSQINGQKISHNAVPAEDQMQAFLYRHLVPAKELTLEPSQKDALLSFEASIPSSGYIELPINQEKRISLKGKFTEKIKAKITLQLNSPPAGLSIVKSNFFRTKSQQKNNPNNFSSGSARGFFILKADDTLTPGMQYSLVLEAVIKQRNKDDLRYAAPAIPVKIMPKK